jgi:2-(1,2-epoxy-1,2-dihydrophenyl)acetyl-CoA isomerase
VSGFAAALPAPEQLLKDIVQPLHDAITIFASMDKPVIVAVSGVAAGAGLGLAMCGDLTLAAQSARFCVAYTGIGASPDAGTSYFLPRRVGLARALELAFDNRVLTAADALAIGLVNAVAPDAELRSLALERAQALASGPTRAYAMTRKLMRQSFDHTLDEQLELEGRGIAAMGSTADFSEGVTAFVAKRKPTFTGS